MSKGKCYPLFSYSETCMSYIAKVFCPTYCVIYAFLSVFSIYLAAMSLSLFFCYLFALTNLEQVYPVVEK